MASAAADSLYGPDRVQKLQAITLEEQERQREESEKTLAYQNRMRLYALLTGLGFLLVIALLLYRNNRHKQKAFELLTLRAVPQMPVGQDAIDVKRHQPYLADAFYDGGRHPGQDKRFGGMGNGIWVHRPRLTACGPLDHFRSHEIVHVQGSQ